MNTREGHDKYSVMVKVCAAIERDRTAKKSEVKYRKGEYINQNKLQWGDKRP